MSISSRSSTDDSIFDIEELLHIEARCRELRREKDLLKETQSQSFDSIKRLELHVRRLNEGRVEDKRQIQALERQLINSHQEIDYLQDQLNTRNAEVVYLQEHVTSLRLKLTGLELLDVEVGNLREELDKSNSESEFLMQELENKEAELQESSLQIEKLEESVACAALEYQCEIESMKLDMLALEERCFEATKSQKELGQEKTKLSELLHELELRYEEAKITIKHLENKNKQVKGILDASEKEAKLSSKTVKEHSEGYLKCNEAAKISIVRNTNIELNENATAEDVCTCDNTLGQLLSKIFDIGTSDVHLRACMEQVYSRLRDHDELVKQLRKEGREEKLRANEEAEDLAQEMAELRYQMTELLEEEHKRRACIEQASLQRISELEAQLRMEQQKPIAPVRPICEA